MEKKTVTYKEPASYFNDAMKKAAADWEKQNKAAQNKSKATSTSKASKKK